VADRPRTFDEVVAAEEPELRERIERAQLYRDPAVENDFHADVVLMENLDGNGEWRVEYQDDEGGCYVTIFAGPKAEERARDLFRGAQERTHQDRRRRASGALRWPQSRRGKYRGVRVGGPPKDKAEHFIKCPASAGLIDNSV
jgi:hypothetical protein